MRGVLKSSLAGSSSSNSRGQGVFAKSTSPATAGEAALSAAAAAAITRQQQQQASVAGLQDPALAEERREGLRQRRRQLLQDLQDRAEDQLFEFGSRQLANSLWALAKLGVELRAGWKAKFLAAAEGCLEEAEPQHLVSMVQAMVQMGWTPNLKWRVMFWRVSGDDWGNWSGGLARGVQEMVEVGVKGAGAFCVWKDGQTLLAS